MSARWALIRTVRRGRPADGAAPRADAPPVFWGRVGAYEGVTRHGTLYLLAPDEVHPALRVTERRVTALASQKEPTIPDTAVRSRT